MANKLYEENVELKNTVENIEKENKELKNSGDILLNGKLEEKIKRMKPEELVELLKDDEI